MPVTWLCPSCRSPLSAEQDCLLCPRACFISAPIQGIRDFLTEPERAQHRAFMHEYGAVRRHEGRGSTSASFYLGLPTRSREREWRLRARGLEWLRDAVGTASGPALDAGAGCCWLSRHLAQWGYEPIALDLTDDDRDGLGAGRHYVEQLGLRFERVLASFTRLPFADESFRLVVFNASFHYAADQAALLREAVRVAQPGAPVVILDSPLYRDAESGRRMLEERGIPGSGFVTDSGLTRLAEQLQLGLRSERPYLGRLSRWRQSRTEARLGRETAAMSRAIFRRAS